MANFKNKLFIIALIFSTQNTFSQIKEIEQFIDSLIAQKMSLYEIPGLAIGITENGKYEYVKGYGVKDIETKQKVNTKSVFHTASISKLFTAIAIAQLVHKGMLTYDDTLIKILPELKYTDKRVEKITLKTLLNHTSGLPDIYDYHWENNNKAVESLRKYILETSLNVTTEPSQSFAYSNLGYDILGLVIEKTTAQNFDEYLKKSVLKVSGMKSSDFRHFEIPQKLGVSPHSKDKITNQIFKRPIYPYTREHAPSSTLNASARDLTNWMNYFLKSLGDSDSVYKILTEPSFGPRIGLGFQLNVLENNKTIGHLGGDQGFRSYLLMIPDKSIGIVLLANCDFNQNFRQEIVHEIAKKLLATN